MAAFANFAPPSRDSVVVVSLRLYDLSRGLATVLAPSIIGHPCEGIWHSGVLVYGKEFFFGSGIQCTEAHEFPEMYGLQPSRTIDLGTTEVPLEVFRLWLSDLGESLFTPQSYHLINHNCNHFADEAVQFLTSHRVPADVTAQASDLMGKLLSSPVAPLILPVLQGLGGPLGQLIPSFSLEPAPPARPQPAASAAASATANASDEGSGLGPAEAAAVESALPALLARSASTSPALASPGPASAQLDAALCAGSPALTAAERQAVLALARAAAEWPTAQLACVAFALRTLVLLPEALALLRERGTVRALVMRTLAPAAGAVGVSVRIMALSVASNLLALPAASLELLADAALTDALLDGAMRLLRDEASPDGARLIASAALYNLTLHAAAHADRDRVTLLLCALVEELGSERTNGELALRLLRALGQLLLHGGPELQELALSLGLGEHTAALAASDPWLHAELLTLLSPSSSAN